MTPSSGLAALLLHLVPLLLLGLAALVAWLSPMIARYVRDKRFALALVTLADTTVKVVGAVAQTVVRDLKDPSKPGTWDERAARAARQEAIAQVRILLPDVISTLKATGRSNADIDHLISTHVEATVLALKDRARDTIVFEAGDVGGGEDEDETDDPKPTQN